MGLPRSPQHEDKPRWCLNAAGLIDLEHRKEVVQARKASGGESAIGEGSLEALAYTGSGHVFANALPNSSSSQLTLSSGPSAGQEGVSAVWQALVCCCPLLWIHRLHLTLSRAAPFNATLLCCRCPVTQPLARGLAAIITLLLLQPAYLQHVLVCRWCSGSWGLPGQLSLLPHSC